jgi:hypothetical protein
MKINIIIGLILFLMSNSYSQILLTPSEVIASPDKYNENFLGMVGTVKFLESFISGNGDRAMKFLLTADNGDYVTIRIAYEELWVKENEKVQVSGVFYKDYGFGLENNLLIVDQNRYGESIIPYEEDKTIKLLDGLLRKLIK